MKNINHWQAEYQSCGYSKRLEDQVILLNKKVTQPVDIIEVKKGIFYARKYHGSQMRQSGEPYYSHPIEVAYMLANYTALNMPILFRTDMIVTALLHDTLEDTELTESRIAEIFGSLVASQVEDLTRVKPYGKISSKEILDLLVQQEKYSVAVIKIFDRIHNMQTLGAKSPKKARKIVQETIEHFLTLCTYLEILPAEEELIELCYKHLSIDPLPPHYKIFFEDEFQILNFQNETTHMQSL